MGKKFNYLNIPSHWEHYWTKYPEGYTILEALLNWVGQVDSMVDNVNDWNEYLDDFVATFDKNLQGEVVSTLSEWQDSGFLDVVIDEALQTQMDVLEQETQEKLNQFSAELAQIETHTGGFVNVMSFGAKGDGVTDDSEAIQSAIDSIPSGIVFFPPKTFVAQGIVPKHNVTLMGYGATLKLPDNPTNHLIYYHNNIELINFNVEGITFNGGVIGDYDLIHITEDDPTAPKKTWYMSAVKYCRFMNAKRGIYCPIPGSVKLTGCDFRYNDIGVEWVQEHFYITDSVFWANRIGINSSGIGGNHFSLINTVLAHNTEYGWLGNATESAFIGCSAIDNKIAAFEGEFKRCRFVGNRIIHGQYGIRGVYERNVVASNYFNLNQKDAITVTRWFNIIEGNQINEATRGIVLGNDLELGTTDNIITNNSIAQMKQEAIRANNTPSSTVISNNRITDVGIEGGYDAIYFATNGYGLQISGNIIRNGSIGKANHAVFIVYNTFQDVILSGNIARNMVIAGYKIPTSGIDNGNVGDFV